MPDSFPLATLIALAKALRDCQVEYAIVGGVAVSLVGRPRLRPISMLFSGRSTIGYPKSSIA